MNIKLVFQENAPHKILTNEHEVETELEAIACGARSRNEIVSVELVSESETNLFIALGGEETVLIFGDPEGKPRLYSSIGPTNASDPWFHFSHLGKMPMKSPRRYVISMEKGLSAAKEFAITGKMPSLISWEDNSD